MNVLDNFSLTSRMLSYVAGTTTATQNPPHALEKRLAHVQCIEAKHYSLSSVAKQVAQMIRVYIRKYPLTFLVSFPFLAQSMTISTNQASSYHSCPILPHAISLSLLQSCSTKDNEAKLYSIVCDKEVYMLTVFTTM